MMIHVKKTRLAVRNINLITYFKRNNSIAFFGYIHIIRPTLSIVTVYRPTPNIPYLG